MKDSCESQSYAVYKEVKMGYELKHTGMSEGCNCLVT